MTVWSEDFTGASVDELLRSQAENRAWNKELRLKSTALVNSRLAKDISLEEYAAHRKQANDDAAECKRRATILANEISCRGARSLPRWSLKMSLPSNFS